MASSPRESRAPARESRAPAREFRTPARESRAQDRESRARARESCTPAREFCVPDRESWSVIHKLIIWVAQQPRLAKIVFLPQNTIHRGGAVALRVYDGS